jgi:hypothetical protein
VLGALSGSTYSNAQAINNRGQIVGESGDQAVIWNGTTPTALDALGAQKSYATDINNRGQVVGWGVSPNFGPYGILWNGATPTRLNGLGEANAINDAVDGCPSLYGPASTTTRVPAPKQTGQSIPLGGCLNNRKSPNRGEENFRARQSGGPK